MKVLILVCLLASLSKGCQEEAREEEVLSFSEAFPFLKTSERRLFQQKATSTLKNIKFQNNQPLDHISYHQTFGIILNQCEL